MAEVSSAKRFHACILEGASPAGLFAHAQRRCAALLSEGLSGRERAAAAGKVEQGNHPDIITLRSDDKPIPVGDVRTLRAAMWIIPNEGACKIAVIGDAALLTPAAQNALLTLLEEPPPYGVIFLLTASRLTLLPTIRSRCVRESVPDSASPPEADEAAEALLSALLGGDELGVLRAALRWDKLPRLSLRSALDGLFLRLGALLLESGGGLTRAAALRMMETVSAHSAALATNAGVGHVCAALAAELWLDLQNETFEEFSV